MHEIERLCKANIDMSDESKLTDDALLKEEAQRLEQARLEEFQAREVPDPSAVDVASTNDARVRNILESYETYEM